MLARLLSILSLLLLLPGVLGQPLLSQPSLVSPEWLAQHLNDPRVRIIDARPSLRDYLQGHIPNAIYLNTETLRISRGGVPGQLLSPKELAAIFSAIGVGNQHTVIVYSSGAEGDFFAHATYVAFVLEWLGHRSVGVLDGGIEKWRAESRPITQAIPQLPPAKFTPRVQRQLVVERAQVLASAQRGDVVLLDARAPAAYRQAHIPTARNAFLRENLQGEGVLTWRSLSDLRAHFQSLGVQAGKPVIAYCTSGREASQLWFTLRHVLKLPNVLIYPGSWLDWSAHQMPVEKPTQSEP
jgi:thiosulfate/3-mercaptopyruvate sulfurtransferase